jgi:hypothetical protein
VLVATQALAALTGVTPDLLLPINTLAPLAGRVCYRVNDPQDSNQNTGLIDCVAYGKYGGDTGRNGTPSPRSPDNRSLQRTNTTGTTLDDFATTLQPTPQNNAGVGVQLATLCGNAAVSGGEQCDGEELGGKTCASEGFASGKLGCTQCHLDTSKCSFCGNDAINTGEACDGPDLGGQTCERLGFTGGTLGCTDKCELSTETCDATFFVPGGGPRGPECQAAWRIRNAAQRPGGDGKASVKQSCRSGDPGCDADSASGTCTFSVALCLDRDDARLAKGTTACKRPGIERVQVVKPGGHRCQRHRAGGGAGGGRPLVRRRRDGDVLAAARLDRALHGGRADHRGDPRDEAGKLVLKLSTTASGGKPVDRDSLKLLCKP